MYADVIGKNRQIVKIIAFWITDLLLSETFLNIFLMKTKQNRKWRRKALWSREIWSWCSGGTNQISFCIAAYLQQWLSSLFGLKRMTIAEKMTGNFQISAFAE